MVLRTNVLALMRSPHGPGSQGELQRKSGVAQATLGRILSPRGENSKIETIEAIAKVYGLEAWQLMVAGFNPANPPVLQPVSQQERELYERLKALSKDISGLER